MSPGSQGVPSAAYLEFLRQANAKGREKADGFDGQLLKSLSESEQLMAIDVLFDLARKGDSTAINGLRNFAPDQVVPFLIGLSQSITPPSLLHAYTCFALWDLTKCSSYADAITKDLTLDDDRARGVATLFVANTVPTRFTEHALWRIVETDCDSINRGTAARGLLFFAKKLRSPVDQITQFDSLLRRICSDQKDEQIHGSKALNALLCANH